MLSITKCTVPVAIIEDRPFLLGFAQVNVRVSAVNVIGTSLPSQVASIFYDVEVPRYVTGNLSYGSNETEWNQIYVNSA